MLKWTPHSHHSNTLCPPSISVSQETHQARVNSEAGNSLLLRQILWCSSQTIIPTHRPICPLLSAMFASSPSQLWTFSAATLNMNIVNYLKKLLHYSNTLEHQLNLPIHILKQKKVFSIQSTYLYLNDW